MRWSSTHAPARSSMKGMEERQSHKERITGPLLTSKWVKSFSVVMRRIRSRYNRETFWKTDKWCHRLSIKFLSGPRPRQKEGKRNNNRGKKIWSKPSKKEAEIPRDNNWVNRNTRLNSTTRKGNHKCLDIDLNTYGAGAAPVRQRVVADMGVLFPTGDQFQAGQICGGQHD